MRKKGRCSLSAHPEIPPSVVRTLFKQWNSIFPTVGLLSLAAFFIAILSGIAVAIPFDVHAPYDALQLMLLSNSGAEFFRNIHYWSAQLFLIFAILHSIEHFALKTERKLPRAVWLRLAISVPFALFVMLSGFLLKADSEGRLARQILAGLFETIPAIGDFIKFTVLGPQNDFQIIYMHHVATATILVLLVTIEHAGRIWPDLRSTLYMFSAAVLLSLVKAPTLQTPSAPVVKGPWYFLGLQEILHWTPHPLWVPVFSVLLLFAFYAIPRTTERVATRMKLFFLLLLGFYCLVTLVGWLFRGANWDFTTPWR